MLLQQHPCGCCSLLSGGILPGGDQWHHCAVWDSTVGMTVHNQPVGLVTKPNQQRPSLHKFRLGLLPRAFIFPSRLGLWPQGLFGRRFGSNQGRVSVYKDLATLGKGHNA